MYIYNYRLQGACFIGKNQELLATSAVIQILRWNDMVKFRVQHTMQL